MFGFNSFYYQSTRKIIVALGALLNGIQINSIDTSNSANTFATTTIPVRFEGKETFLMRLATDPTALKGDQITLPTMSYDLLGISYDSQRKLSPYIKNQMFNTSNNTTQYACAAPYNLNFEVNLYVRNVEDGLQVIEQIIPFFTPDYTIQLKYLVNAASNTYVSEQVPFVFEGINYQNEYEGPAGTVRMVTWTMNFTAKALYFGPTPSNSVIKEVIINLRDGNSMNVVSTIEASVDPISANVTDNYNVVVQVTESSANV